MYRKTKGMQKETQKTKERIMRLIGHKRHKGDLRRHKTVRRQRNHTKRKQRAKENI